MCKFGAIFVYSFCKPRPSSWGASKKPARQPACPAHASACSPGQASVGSWADERRTACLADIRQLEPTFPRHRCRETRFKSRLLRLALRLVRRTFSSVIITGSLSKCARFWQNFTQMFGLRRRASLLLLSLTTAHVRPPALRPFVRRTDNFV
jgi:hypothetical protein